ncbi:MAG TPA: hypothetical protein VKF39_05005 [Nitrososphaerales archaeon]|nr:hypothetical protein [Nitrososphaerales archaeon]
MEPGVEEGNWKGFMRRHWGAVAVFAITAVLAVAGAVYVFWWFVGLAQSSGLVPSSLGLWSMGNLIGFILNAIFWEILLIGIPVIVGAVIAWLWWRRLPAEERHGYHWGKSARRSGTSGGFGLFFFILFVIKVYLDGKWNMAIATFDLNYVVGSMITILVWVAVVFGIPATIVAIWWIRHEMKKT